MFFFFPFLFVGSVEPSKRQSIVNQFNSDPTIDLLLLTTHVGGLGLNLTGADTGISPLPPYSPLPSQSVICIYTFVLVIFVEHDWNPMKDLQAMDRAHRLGQTKVVNVYRLIARGTLEEKIMGYSPSPLPPLSLPSPSPLPPLSLPSPSPLPPLSLPSPSPDFNIFFSVYKNSN